MFGVYNTNNLYFAKIGGEYARNSFFTIVKPLVVDEPFYDKIEYLYKDIFSKYYYYTQDDLGDLYIENIIPLFSEMPKKYMTTKQLNEWLEKNKKYYAS